MGTFRYPLEVGASTSGPFVLIEAVLDTGASYSQIPRPVLERLALAPIEQAEFVLADGRTTMRDIVEVFVRLDGRVRSTVCVVAGEGAPALLGAYTLEGFGLTVDPTNKRLVRGTLYLL